MAAICARSALGRVAARSAQFEHDLEPVILAVRVCVQSSQRVRPGGDKPLTGGNARFRIAQARAQQDEAATGARMRELEIERHLGTEGKADHVRTPAIELMTRASRSPTTYSMPTAPGRCSDIL